MIVVIMFKNLHYSFKVLTQIALFVVFLKRKLRLHKYIFERSLTRSSVCNPAEKSVWRLRWVLENTPPVPQTIAFDWTRLGSAQQLQQYWSSSIFVVSGAGRIAKVPEMFTVGLHRTISQFDRCLAGDMAESLAFQRDQANRWAEILAIRIRSNEIELLSQSFDPCQENPLWKS